MNSYNANGKDYFILIAQNFQSPHLHSWQHDYTSLSDWKQNNSDVNKHSRKFESYMSVTRCVAYDICYSLILTHLNTFFCVYIIE